ncbi:MAG: ABC-F family ATP-binding cassette domain-containing protein [Muribaculaceae bacterium]|nr:ABC-F family ATP-binding cassette domain-containing protein [Muribaculaceae bacterium]
MASFLQVENLTKSYGDRILFADVTFGINDGDKIGLIAKNVMGKTTLLRCIAGMEGVDSGSVTFRSDLRISYLEQTPQLDNSLTVLETCIADSGDIIKAITAYEKALASDDIAELTRATELMDMSQAWDYEERLKQMLSQLGITNLTQPVSQLSGGQKKRVALAKIILENPELIILDEPTNHLDISSIEWLESFLSRSKMAILMVTHDRYFLDRVCDRIIEIDHGQIFSYEGNYNNYLRRRQERIEAMTAELAKVKNTLRREQEWMNRQPQARAGKAKFRIDAFYDLKKRAAVDLRERNVDLSVKSAYIGSKIFEASHISKRFGDKVILNDFNYVFSRYEKLGIIGSNGVGKSTFVKMLQGLVSSEEGTWDIGETVRFGYYSQDGISFNPEKKVIDAITEIAEDIVVNDGTQRFSPSQFLQHFLFSPADQQKFIAKLSGGERSRLHLASVLMKSPNFLILDEPTNDLDIVTLGILEEYLAEFKGCAIIISHDRYFLDNIVDHLFVLEGNGIVKDFPGNYSDYRLWKAEADEKTRLQKAAQEQATSGKTATKPKSSDKNRMTFKERKEFEALESEIEALNSEKNALEAEFAAGSGVADIQEKSQRYNEIQMLLDEKELRWLELSEKS